MSTKKRVLIVIIVAILVGVVVFPMLPLEYRERITAILAHPLYYLGLGRWWAHPRPKRATCKPSKDLWSRRVASYVHSPGRFSWKGAGRGGTLTP